jgi:hypothetical protein
MATKLHFVKKSRKRYKQGATVINKGESYFWWKFKNSPRYISKEKPKRSRLTRSAYLATAWDIEDDILTSFETLSEAVSHFEEIKERIEQLRDEQQDKLNSMPENLRESPSAQTLQERYDHLEEIVRNLDGIDTTIADGNEEDEENEGQGVIDEIISALENISLEA